LEDSVNREELIEEIKTSFGHPTVKIELDDIVWDKIINKASRWFKSKKGLIYWLFMDITGVDSYDWPADALQILDVILPRRSDIADILSLGFFDIVPARIVPGISSYPSLQGAGVVHFDSSAYLQLLQTLEMRRRVFSSDPGWYVLDHPIRKIMITARDIYTAMGGGTGLKMLIFYKKTTVSLADLQGRDEDMYIRYCIARAKQVLGEIRSKYPSYPSAGGAISMNGNELKQEAVAELAGLDQEIDDSQGNAGGIAVD
jgi:hypothetical protein